MTELLSLEDVLCGYKSNKYDINEMKSLVNNITNEDASSKLVIKLRDALREELDAINTYDSLLLEVSDEDKEIIEEIKKDEINHAGRLSSMIFKLMPQEKIPFDNGTNNEE